MWKAPTSIRLSDEAKRLIALVAEKLALSKTAIVELAVRDFAKRNKVE